MIQHILSLLWNQRKSNAWLWVELILVSVFLWGIVDYLYVTGNNYFSPLGYDISHTYRIALKELSDKSDLYIPETEKTTTLGEDILTIADRIRTYPGIEAVSISSSAMPYSQSDRSRMIFIDTATVHVQHYEVDAAFFRVFRTPIAQEKTASLNREVAEPYVVVVTEDVQKKVAGGFQPGQRLYLNASDSVAFTIRGISSPIRRHEYTLSYPGCFLLLTDQQIASTEAGGTRWLDLCVRVAPEADRDFASRFRKEMSRQVRVGNVYLMDVQSLSDLRHAFILQLGAENDLRTRLAVAFFLLINIFLGIIGTFWLRTEYRKGEMGLRMALGSTRGGLRTLLVREGLVLLALAALPALLISLNAAYMDVVNTRLMPFTWLRFLICQSITLGLIGSMIVMGIWYPARRTASLEPADALHYE